jgi:hypothetical protein
MKLSVAVLTGLAMALLVLPVALSAGSEGSAKSAGRTKVVCLSDKNFNPDYKFRPKHCIFHKRHSPNAEAVFVRTKHDRWRVWNRHRARGKGKAIASMIGSTPVRIELSKPVQRCGHRVFSHAHFRFPRLNHGGGMNLDTCA